MKEIPSISVIICTYNREQYIYCTLQRIAENDFPTSKYEVVLINNNSTDLTEKECLRFEADFPNIHFHYFIETAQGLSFARNRGAQEAQGDFLVYLDDDAFVSKSYLKNLNKHLLSHPNLVAFGGKITPLYESGIVPLWMSKWSYSWVSALDMGKQIRLFQGHSFPIGANMGFRKDCIQQYGYFDTTLGRSKNNLLAGEEKDYFNRLKHKNNNIYYLPDVEVEHIIPEQRTTTEFIIKLALGIGTSERLRTLGKSKKLYLQRILMELFKWGCTLVLYIYYTLRCTYQKGWKLLLFRWYVTKSLIGK